MPATNKITIETAGPDDWPRLLRVDELAFGYTAEDEDSDPERLVLEMDRTLLASAAGEDAGIASTYSLEMSLPGVARAPVAGLTWVGVLPTHRRTGILTALMRHHLDDLHENNREPVAALYASEPGIYGRFGYGLASQRLSVTIPREFARLTHPPAADDPRPRLVSPQDVRPQLALVADAVRAQRPAIPVRNSAWWDRTLYDATSVRRGGSELRALLVEDESGPRGYALYRTKDEWDSGGSKGTLMIREIMAVDPVAHRALWQVLLSTDLIGEVAYGMLPVDDPLMHQLVNPRRVTPLLVDAVFVRVVDVARALTARAYASDVDLVIDLIDDFCPWNSGHWQLSANADGVTCAPTTEAADLRLDASTLGAIYLGGTSLQSLADAGRVVEHRAGSIGETSRAFLSGRAPWCPFVF